MTPSDPPETPSPLPNPGENRPDSVLSWRPELTSLPNAAGPQGQLRALSPPHTKNKKVERLPAPRVLSALFFNKETQLITK